MSANDGGPAFPRSDGGHSATQDGMSLRDYFAGQVLGNSELVTGDWGVGNERELAHLAYTLADAMLKAREAK